MQRDKGEEMGRKIFLICGIASSLLYVAMNILCALQYERAASQDETFFGVRSLTKKT
jgi:hypothetical protein